MRRFVAPLICGVFILGCQDLGQDPLGPEGPDFHHAPGSCKGHHKNDPGCDGGGSGDGDGAHGTLVLSGAATSPATAAEGEVVKYCLQTANRRKMVLFDCENVVSTIGPFAADIDVGFADTHLAGIDACTSEPPDMSNADRQFLIDLLVNNGNERALNVTVDRRNLPGTSSDHRFATTYRDVNLLPNPGPIDIRIEGDVHATGDPSAVGGSYTFSDGVVTIMDRRSADVKVGTLTCPNLDAVTMTVNPN